MEKIDMSRETAGRYARQAVVPFTLTAILILTGILCAAPQARGYETLTCSNKIIAVGYSKYNVGRLCGEPAWKDIRQEKITEGFGAGLERQIIVPIEKWIYNFGPNKFIKVLQFRDDRLEGITTGGYGYLESEKPSFDCGERIISPGDTAYDVLRRCGQPTYKTVRNEEIIRGRDTPAEYRVETNVERWTYDFGPNRFVLILRFENGILFDIRTGDYGQ